MCFNIFRFADMHIYPHTKKNYQGDSNHNWSPLDIYQVYYDIQNTESFWWRNAHPYFPHADIYSFIVCILPRWDLFIYTVSQRLDIIDLTDGLSIQSL